MLFVRELKKVVCSVSYVLFVIIAVLALSAQGALDFSGNVISEPAVGENYGIKNEERPELIMPAALQSLYAEFLENDYACYPIGLIKHVKLDEEGQMRIAERIADLTGMDVEEIFRAQGTISDDGNAISFEISGDGNLQSDSNGGFMITGETDGDREDTQETSISLSVREDLSYGTFQERMQEIDDILGGGSSYAAESLIGFGQVALTYEEAMTAYELAVSYDKLTGGYARLFSDYAVAIVFSVLPVFLAIWMSSKDRSAKMAELIYSRRTSGIKIVFVRYLAVLTAVMLPAVILSYVSNVTVWSLYPGMTLDYLAPLAYDFGWIMPSAMMAIAVGMFLTELTNTPIAAAVQGLWWFVDVNAGIRSVSASYALLRLAPRHNAGTNSYFRTRDLIDNFSNLLANRLLFAGLSILLVMAAAVVFEAKRKGEGNGNRKLQRALARMGNRRNSSQA